MLKCIAIDDEPLALRQLQGYIAKINFLKLEKAFTNAIEAQQYLAGNPIDLIFVDINMPDLSGVEFVRSLVSRPMIIFTTAYSEYAVEGFKLDAIDYLLKPFSFADFSRSAAKAQSLYELLAYRKTQGNAPAPGELPHGIELRIDSMVMHDVAEGIPILIAEELVRQFFLDQLDLFLIG